ncbi:glycosyltransferase family 2 protein [Stenotrophomonas sp. VV52]|uniref:glycosyltransferase family 2 protein n=1 Tax=Stenotrophomonas sp. VV52 TaxID=2066958 RepID=UPI001558B6C4|nr:glycosyltransferase family 2 protein [Stenotrophomonas sp. VV52]
MDPADWSGFIPDGTQCIALGNDYARTPTEADRRWPAAPGISGLKEDWAARQVLYCLKQIESERGSVAHVSLPCLGASGFWLLQERFVHQAFAATTVSVRLTGLTVLEAAREGRALSTSDLLTADMERRCLTDCDELRCEKVEVAASIIAASGIDGGSWKDRLALPTYSEEPLAARPGPSSAHIAGVISEPAALRQFVRASIGFIGSTAGATACIKLHLVGRVSTDGLAAVPPAWRNRFELISRDQLAGVDAPGAVVFADSWSASADLARAALGQGRQVIVDARNPAYPAGAGWDDGRNVLRYDGTAASLVRVLAKAAEWRPQSQLMLEWSAGRQLSAVRAREPVASPRVEQPLVSVLVPHFNLGAYLPTTLANLRECSYTSLEIIVIDDGSTDPSSINLIEGLAAASDSSVSVLRLPFNQGLAAARNAGLSAARGKYVLTLDADDLIAPQFVGEAVSALERLADFDFVVPQAAYFDDAHQVSEFKEVAFQQCIPLVGEAWQSGMFANRYSTATCLGRLGIMRELCYDESLRAYEDWEFYQRALDRGSRFLVTSDVNFLYRRRPDSMIHAPEMRSRHAQLMAEMSGRGLLSRKRIKVARQSLQVVCAPLGVDGDALHGLLLADVGATLQDIRNLRRSRIVGTAYRLSAVIGLLRRRLAALRS